jgi:hypothetical protein
MLVVLSLRETLKITERGHLNNDILNIMVHVTDRQKINDDDQSFKTRLLFAIRGRF